MLLNYIPYIECFIYFNNVIIALAIYMVLLMHRSRVKTNAFKFLIFQKISINLINYFIVTVVSKQATSLFVASSLMAKCIATVT